MMKKIYLSILFTIIIMAGFFVSGLVFAKADEGGGSSGYQFSSGYTGSCNMLHVGSKKVVYKIVTQAHNGKSSPHRHYYDAICKQVPSAGYEYAWKYSFKSDSGVDCRTYNQKITWAKRNGLWWWKGMTQSTATSCVMGWTKQMTWAEKVAKGLVVSGKMSKNQCINALKETPLNLRKILYEDHSECRDYGSTPYSPTKNSNSESNSSSGQSAPVHKNSYKPQVTAKSDKSTYWLGEKVILTITGKDADKDKVKTRLHVTKPDGKTITSKWSAMMQNGYTWVTGKGGFYLTDKSVLNVAWNKMQVGKYTITVEIADEHGVARKGKAFSFTIKAQPKNTNYQHSMHY